MLRVGRGGGFARVQDGFAVPLGMSLSLDLLLAFLVRFMALDCENWGQKWPIGFTMFLLFLGKKKKRVSRCTESHFAS